MHSPASTTPTVSRRQERRRATIEEIKTLARRQLAEQGAGALSLRAIAREMRMASSALYRYFPSYEDLISALIVDAYTELAVALEIARDAQPPHDHARQWWAMSHAYRRWGLDGPADFALLFGTPLPGYQAPEHVTGPAASRLLAIPLEIYAAAVHTCAADPNHTQVPATLQVGELLGELLRTGASDCPPRLASITLSAWTALLGFLVAEIFGSLSRLITDTDELYSAHVRTVMLHMGFEPALTQTAARHQT